MSATRRRAPLWARVLVVSGATLVLVSGLALAGGRYLLARYTASVHQESLLGGAEASPAPGGVAVAGPINVLLVGTDERAGDPTDGARSDSIIIVHVDAAHDHAYLVSIPRDSLVDIPAYPKSGFAGGRDKINAAYQDGSQNGAGRAGGFALLAMTIKQLTGISFNAGAIVNFAGFHSLVAALGGVDMCVDEKTTSIHIGWTASGKETVPYRVTANGVYPIRGVRPQVYQPGCQHMAAWQALDYVRQRELIPDGDYGRQRHQQQFLEAVMKEATGAGVLTNPIKLDRVLKSAGQALTVDSGGVSLTNWIFTLKGMSPADVTMLKTNGGNFNSATVGGVSVELLSDDSRQLLTDVRDDDVATFVATHPTWVTAAPQS